MDEDRRLRADGGGTDCAAGDAARLDVGDDYGHCHHQRGLSALEIRIKQKDRFY